MYLYSALSWSHLALRYGTCSQGISQFYLHTPRSSANGMNQTFEYCAVPRSGTYAFPAEVVLIYRPRRDGRLSWPGAVPGSEFQPASAAWHLTSWCGVCTVDKITGVMNKIDWHARNCDATALTIYWRSSPIDTSWCDRPIITLQDTRPHRWVLFDVICQLCFVSPSRRLCVRLSLCLCVCLGLCL